MNTKFQWLLVVMSGAALAAPVQADPPSYSNANGHGARPAPRASTGSSAAGYRNAAPSFRPPQSSGRAPMYSAGSRFSSMNPSFRPPQNYSGSTPRYSTGQRFSSRGAPDAAWRERFPATNVQSRANAGPQSASRPAVRPQSRLQSSNFQERSNAGPTTKNDFDRTSNTRRTGTFQNDRGDRLTQFGSINRTSATAQNHVFAQRSADWQPNWDRNCDHWWNGHRCRFVNNSWIIFDFGFYPWWPIGYPYDYGYGYGYDYYPSGYGYDPGYYGDGQYYGQGEYYGQDQYYGQDGYNSPDQYGDADSPVAAAQAQLARQGYYHGRIDGVFGPETRRAVVAFQRDHGLNPTGYLTRDTRSALGLR